jgi:hypothetical protein
MRTGIPRPPSHRHRPVPGRGPVQSHRGRAPCGGRARSGRSRTDGIGPTAPGTRAGPSRPGIRPPSSPLVALCPTRRSTPVDHVFEQSKKWCGQKSDQKSGLMHPRGLYHPPRPPAPLAFRGPAAEALRPRDPAGRRSDRLDPALKAFTNVQSLSMLAQRKRKTPFTTESEG